MNHPDKTDEPHPLPRILVVEDERPMRTVLQDVLERQGYRVLLARVRVLLRRAIRAKPMLRQAAFGEVRIDFAQHQAWRRDEPVPLTAKEFEILRLLLERPGEVVSRERFLDAGWGYTAFPTTRTVDRHIATLRAKLGDDAEAPRWICTVHRIGYRFAGEIELG